MEKSKGFIESEISKAITKWEKDFLGRGSLSVKTNILQDMIIVNLQGILHQLNILYVKQKQGC